MHCFTAYVRLCVSLCVYVCVCVCVCVCVPHALRRGTAAFRVLSTPEGTCVCDRVLLDHSAESAHTTSTRRAFVCCTQVSASYV